MTAPRPTPSPAARVIELIVAIERLIPELSAAEQLEVHNALVPFWQTLLQNLFSRQVGPAAVSRERPDPC